MPKDELKDMSVYKNSQKGETQRRAEDSLSFGRRAIAQVFRNVSVGKPSQ